MKKFSKLKVLSLLAIVLLLSACGSSLPKESKQLDLYNEGVVAANEESMFQFSETYVPDGYFVRKNDLFYPLLRAGIGNRNSKKFQWFQDYEKFIPELGPGDKLTLVSSDRVPTEFIFHKMEDLGSTIGMFFNINELSYRSVNEGNRDLGLANADYEITKSNEINDTTESYNNLQGLPKESIFTDIKSKDGLHPLTRDMFTEDGIIRGLSKDKPYEMKFYLGTKFEQVVLLADTHVFVSDTEYKSTDVKKMQNVYFEITLPENMEPGYYMVNGYGTFFYQGK